MILKCMSGKNSKQTLNYVFRDPKKLENEENKKLVIRKNVRGRKLDTWMEEFKENEATRKYKRRDQVKMIHSVLSFHANDSKHVTEKVLKTMTKEYMRLRGENMYIAVAHFNEEHKHIHICESGTRLDGKANRLSKKEFEKLRVQLQEFQEEKFKELTNSLPNHDKTKKRERNIPQIQSLRNSNKANLLKLLEEAKTNAKSKEDFYNTIKDTGHTIYQRNGKETGITYNGEAKFRFKTLGFDTKQLDALEQEQQTEQREQKQITELDELRSRSSSSQERESSRSGRALNEEDDQHELEDEAQEMDDDFTR
jgi:hypothetical protein